MRLSGYAALLLAFTVLVGATAAANPRSEALRREGYDAAYNLDYERAKDLFAQEIGRAHV
jgi:hypothetical protein